MSFGSTSRRGVGALAWVAAALSAAGWLAGGQARAAEPYATSAACGDENLLAGKQPMRSEGLSGSAALLTDGSVAYDGTDWDGPFAARLEPGGFVIYDLGQPRSIGAVFFQGDANDTYKITGSLDGSPGSYRFVVEIPNVVEEKGHGLRTRAVEVQPMTARYLRVGDAVGDNRFSLGELAVYCRAPRPFPPAFPTVGAAPVAQLPPRAQHEPMPADDQQSGGGALFVAAAALAIAGAASLLLARRARREAQASAAAGAGVPVAGAASTEAALRVLFLASGCAALIYEVVWFHLLRLVIGASALSVAIVLASFMGGMFLGSLFFARFVPADRHPLRVYGLLEIGIGVFGLLMPLMLPVVRFVYVGLVGYGPLGIALRALIGTALLIPPTALMGATLPAVARRFAPGAHGMSGLAGLYAANTTGAVVGSLLSAFLLLAIWDVWVATAAAAVLNFAVGAYALRLAHSRSTATAATPDPVSVPVPVASATRPDVVYLAVALSGLTALGAQVVWTRLLTLLFGGTVYAFAIILAVFLAGLGIGSALAARLLRRGYDPVRALTYSQILLVPALMLSGALLAYVLPYASPSSQATVSALYVLQVLRAADVILPAALLWGMSFPFALAAAAAAEGAADTGRSSGRVYAANTVGAIAGALAVSFWIIPTWGTKWAERSLVLGAAVSAAALFVAARRAQRWPAYAGTFALAAGALAAGLLPGLSTVWKAHGRYIWWVDGRDQYPYVSEGAASTVAVHVAPSGYRNFHVSGRVEASNNPNDMRLQRLLGHLSALAHPKPESVLVVGLGAGTTAGALALHPEVERIVICEIEPRVVGAAKLFALENYRVLDDPRVQMVFDDARHFLATTREKFDIITSDPIHPWVRGNSALFSREYYEIVRAHLRPGGIATQWVPLYETSELAIKIQMRTFVDVFPAGTVWNSAANNKGYDVVLLGGAQQPRIDLAAIEARIARSPRIAQSLRDVRIASVGDLLGTYGTSGPDMQSWLSGTPVNRDFSLKLEYISGLALNANEADAIYAHMIAGRAYPEALFAGSPEAIADLRRRIQGGTAGPPQARR